MKKNKKIVSFGFDSSPNPNGVLELPGLNEHKEVGPIKAEFIGFIGDKGDHYLVSRVIETYDSEDQIGQIDVRRALADIYPDGNGKLYLDSAHTLECRIWARALSSEKTKKALERGVSLEKILPENSVPFSFNCVTQYDYFNAIAIKHEAFERKKALINGSYKTFSQLQEEIENTLGENNLTL